MKRILVTYATFAGSTAKVAQCIADELVQQGATVDVLPLSDVSTLTPYDGVVIGAPMIMGWHRAAIAFLKKHRAALHDIPFAVFVMAMSLTQTNESIVNGVRVTIDEKLAKSPQTPGHLTFRERYARVPNYVRPILNAARPALPQSIGLFGGQLEYGRLKWWAVLFVALIIRAPAGDRRNWTAIRDWAGQLRDIFQLHSPMAEWNTDANINADRLSKATPVAV